MGQAIAKAGDPTQALIRAMAMDIGKEVVHHIETMYPSAIAACPATFKLSVRNCVHNEIMAAIAVNLDSEIVMRLNERKKFRRKMKKAFTQNRAKP